MALQTVLIHTLAQEVSVTETDRPAEKKVHGSYGSTNVRFLGPQQDISRSHRSMDMRAVCCTVCLFTSQLISVKIIQLGDKGENWTRDLITSSDHYITEAQSELT